MRRAVAALAVVACSVVACSVVAGCGGTPAPGAKTPAAAASPPANVSSLGSQWSLTFDATFAGSKLNTSVWGTCYPWQSPRGCTNFGNSSEDEWYVPAQDQVYGGALHLVPERISTPGRASDGKAKEYQYRSGMVTTYPSYNFTYGYVQVVARIPDGSGLWPALWMLPTNLHWPPEIDIIEHYGDSPVSWQHLHSPTYPTQMASESTPNLFAGWHTFGLYWSPDQVAVYIDGKRVFDDTHAIPRQSMYLLADLAVYQPVQSGWNAASDSMAIASVSVWQARSYSQTGSPGGPVTPSAGAKLSRSALLMASISID
jgi:beta-glucanase (GH16 family)